MHYAFKKCTPIHWEIVGAGKVSIHQLKCYAYHGCLPEEAVIGTNYSIDMDVWLDFTQAAEHDDLSKTADYVILARIIQEEMAVRSKLIEQVAKRIIDRCRASYPEVEKIAITIHKINPPAQADLTSVSVYLEG